MKINSNFRRAFTLLEIMLVVTIIALLLGSAIYAFKDKLGFAQDTRVKADLQSISTALMVYQGMNGFYPSTDQGLKALVTRPDSNPRPRQWRPSFDKVPLDPWGNEYKYVQPGTHNPDSYDLYSVGPHGQDGAADNVGNWDSK
jgi:general secretion pathway protein G